MDQIIGSSVQVIVNNQSKSKKFMVMSMFELVIGHDQLYVSTKLMGYQAQKRVNYNVRPTMQKIVEEVQQCQKVTKYVI